MERRVWKKSMAGKRRKLGEVGEKQKKKSYLLKKDSLNLRLGKKISLP